MSRLIWPEILNDMAGLLLRDRLSILGVAENLSMERPHYYSR